MKVVLHYKNGDSYEYPYDMEEFEVREDEDDPNIIVAETCNRKIETEEFRYKKDEIDRFECVLGDHREN